MRPALLCFGMLVPALVRAAPFPYEGLYYNSPLQEGELVGYMTSSLYVPDGVSPAALQELMRAASAESAHQTE